MGLQQFEQRLERLVEGAFSKALRGGLQPVEIARRLTREMDLLRRVGVRGLIAPNDFVGPVTVELRSLDTLRAGRFTVHGEVREGADGMTAGSVVLPDGSRIVL